jgi:large subunit ribosomal protein L10
MSKAVKQMEMTSLKDTFKEVRDLVVMSISGLSGTATTSFRSAMRKKKVKFHIVKNSLARKVFTDLGLNLGDADPGFWIGPTAFAYGADSVAGLSKAIDGELKGPKTAPIYKDRVKIKGAVADGQEVPFDVALRMPTWAEAVGSVVAALLGPASALAGCLVGPGGQLASQIKKISEKEPAAEAAPPAAEAPPPAAEAAPPAPAAG